MDDKKLQKPWPEIYSIGVWYFTLNRGKSFWHYICTSFSHILSLQRHAKPKADHLQVVLSRFLLAHIVSFLTIKIVAVLNMQKTMKKLLDSHWIKLLYIWSIKIHSSHDFILYCNIFYVYRTPRSVPRAPAPVLKGH